MVCMHVLPVRITVTCTCLSPLLSESYTAAHLAELTKSTHIVCESSDILGKDRKSISYKKTTKQTCTLLGKLEHSHSLLQVN